MANENGFDNKLTDSEREILEAFWTGKRDSIPPTLYLKLPQKDVLKVIEKTRQYREANAAKAKEEKKRRDKAGREKYPVAGVRIYGKPAGERSYSSKSGAKTLYEPVTDHHKKLALEAFGAIGKNYRAVTLLGQIVALWKGDAVIRDMGIDEVLELENVLARLKEAQGDRSN